MLFPEMKEETPLMGAKDEPLAPSVPEVEFREVRTKAEVRNCYICLTPSGEFMTRTMAKKTYEIPMHYGCWWHLCRHVSQPGR